MARLAEGQTAVGVYEDVFAKKSCDRWAVTVATRDLSTTYRFGSEEEAREFAESDPRAQGAHAGGR